MRFNTLTSAGIALAIATLVMPMSASANHGWKTLGVQQVDGARDRDVVRVWGRERFRQIRICVYRGAVRFRDLDVRFANGRTRDLPIRGYFRPGTCSRAIDLPGHRRDIGAIMMRYGGSARYDRGWRYRDRYDHRRHGRFVRPLVVVYGR